MRHVGAARVRVALPRGLACHVASTWGPRQNKPNFFLFKNGLNSKIKSEKNPEKSLKIVKIISFKIQLQINPDFFSLALKFNYLSL